MEKFITVITTTETEKEAEKIAETLVSEKLAACVQIIPSIKSVYRWQGKVEKSEEHLLFIKTKESLFEKVEKAIKENHSYEVPEIISIPVNSGSKEYLEWIKSVTL
ncbi:divalent-cation tolerance protein CutA [Desulfurobacterium atlanticum]|uniref:Divalent cation tolerance protein n=1 Tax=Desulfurobacterium atlanticum TaxID=240169 RepID=A0A238XQK3_9BACT|nr:divalent-cation tolerance protein CutA [Desulfurobacterium atlanticum]SNR60259.1 divalent cation tolerance protein [Desulfurobacterium atlanticum]